LLHEWPYSSEIKKQKKRGKMCLTINNVTRIYPYIYGIFFSNPYHIEEIEADDFFAFKMYFT